MDRCQSMPSSAELLAQHQAQWIKDKFARLNAVGVRFLDVGCGTGMLTNYLKELFWQAQVTGIDVDERALAQAGERYAFQGIEFVQADARSLAFEQAAFDCVVVSNVFHHLAVANRAAVVEECVRVLKPGGMLVIFELNPWNGSVRWRVWHDPNEAESQLLEPPNARALVRQCADVQIWHDWIVPEWFPAARALERVLQWVPLSQMYTVTAIKKK